MIWNCAFDNQGTRNATGITVGQKLELFCSGEAIEMDSAQLQIAPKVPTDPAEPANFFSDIKLLEVKILTPTSGHFIVTTYKVGSNQSDALVLTDGKNRVEIPGFSWEVKTVIEQPQATPFPEYGTWKMTVSWYYWLLLALVVAGIFFQAYRSIKRVRSRRKFFEDLKGHQTSRSAYDELHHVLRKMERSLPNVEPLTFLKELEHAYRLYLVRELEVPALDWSDTLILQEIKSKNKSVHSVLKNEMRNYFSEIRKLKNKMRIEDCEYVLRSCQKLSDRISDLVQLQKDKKS